MKNIDRLRKIYRRTDGYCHLCHAKLSFTNYGKNGLKGAWHIEHSKARCNGGTDHLNNLYAACISCNIEKADLRTNTIRKRNGLSRAPYSRARKAAIKKENRTGGVVIGASLGMALGGPVGGFIGGLLGAAIGESSSPGI